MQARFITVEGGEGAGKSVFTHGLSQALQMAGIPVVLSREPGGTPLADGLRELFLHPPEGDKPTPAAELLLVSAARAQHVAMRVKPLLHEGKWVLCDRFYDSTRVYQGVLGGLDAQDLEPIVAFSVGNCHPHLSFILDCPVELALQRIESREKAQGLAAPTRNRFDAGSKAMHEKLRQGYLSLAKKFPDRIVLIGADAKPEVMVQQAMDVIRQRWSL